MKQYIDRVRGLKSSHREPHKVHMNHDHEASSSTLSPQPESSSKPDAIDAGE